MDNIIKEFEAEPLSNNDILELCDNKTKVIRYSELDNYNNIDELLDPYNNFVILYETSENYGHWCCVLRYGDILEFFDPYGYGVDEQLKFSENKYPLLSNLMLNSNYKLIENKTRLQKLYNNVASCGRHVAIRIILGHLDIYSYLSLFYNNKYDPDMIVTYMTSFIN